MTGYCNECEIRFKKGRKLINFGGLLRNADVKKQWLDSVHGTALRLFSVGINLIIGIICARLLGEIGFGQYVSYLAIGGVIASITSIGLPTVLAREIAAGRGVGDLSRLPAIAQTILAAQFLLIVAILTMAMLGFLSATYALLFALGTNLLGVVSHVFMGVERVLTSQWIASVFRPLLAIAAFLLLACISMLSVRNAFLVQAATAAISAGVLCLMWRSAWLRDAPRLFLAHCRFSEYSSVIRTGLTFAGAQVLINAMTQIDILILTALRSPEDVALYYSAARAALVVSFFFGSVSKLAEPKLVRLIAGGKIAEARNLARSTSLLGLGMTVVAVALAALLGRFYLGLYGDVFLAALPVMFIMMAGQVGLAMTGPAQPILRASRSDGSIVMFAGIAVVVGAGVTVALLFPLGILGAAIGTSIQFTLFGWLLSRAAERETGIATPVWRVFKKQSVS